MFDNEECDKACSDVGKDKERGEEIQRMLDAYSKN